jgi:hypothetical protein
VSRFRKTLGEFRDELESQTVRAGTPALQSILDRERPRRNLALRWAFAATLAITLGSIPVYRDAQERARQRERESADTRLMQQIDASLSRSVPRAFGALVTGGEQ